MSDTSGAATPSIVDQAHEIDRTIVPASAPTIPDDPRDRRVFYLGVVLLVMTFLIVVALFFRPMPQENAQVLTTLIGLFGGTGLGSVISYYFGSSAGSKAKDDAMISSIATGTGTGGGK